MPPPDSCMTSAAPTWTAACHSPLAVIEDESEWRRLAPGAVHLGDSRLVATRWRALEKGGCAVSTETPAGWHVVGIALRGMEVSLRINDRLFYEGAIMPGTVLALAPGIRARCLFEGPSEALHLHVPTELLARFADERADTPSLWTDAALVRDPLIERLAQPLLEADEIGGSLAPLYVDGLGSAIIARLLDCTSRPVAERPRIGELPRWRLKRVLDYVEAHLGDTVNLADLAAAAGLTRMHFAAQFHAATGLRPHHYLVRRRIERARDMLLQGDTPLVEVALSVGFQTQSHFTSVFKTLVGRPPNAWRRMNRRRARLS